MKDAGGEPYTAQQRASQCAGQEGRGGGEHSHHDIYVLTVKPRQIDYASYVTSAALQVRQLTVIAPGYLAGTAVMEVASEGTDDVEKRKASFTLKRNGPLLSYGMDKNRPIAYEKCGQ